MTQEHLNVISKCVEMANDELLDFTLKLYGQVEINRFRCSASEENDQLQDDFLTAYEALKGRLNSRLLKEPL